MKRTTIDKKSFVVYSDYYQHLEDLTLEQKGKIFDAMFNYSITGEYKINGIEGMAFSFIKSQMDRDTDKWTQRADKSRENGKKGGRPKANLENPVGYSETQPNLSEPKEPVNVTVTVNDTVNVNESVNTYKKALPPRDTTSFGMKFTSFQKQYPKHKATKRQSDAAYEIWIENDLHRISGDIEKGLLAWVACSNWREANGQYVPKISNFLLDEQWSQKPSSKTGDYVDGGFDAYLTEEN